jgi:hypothetical protein
MESGRGQGQPIGCNPAVFMLGDGSQSWKTALVSMIEVDLLSGDCICEYGFGAAA